MSAPRETARRLLLEHREAGTSAADRARRVVADHLTELGYRVTFQRFRFHPAALLGFPIFGAGVGASALLALPLLTLPAVPPAGALAVWSILLAATSCLALGVAAGWLARGDEREDANLIAVRSDAPIRRWIVAHLDTKAQAQSMAGRLVAVWVLAVALLATGVLAVVRLWGPVPLWLGASSVALSVVAGALAGRGRLRGTTPGARDNGTGVLAALASAEVSRDEATGVLITGAEEFGLVGARFFAAQGSLHGVEVVNFDTIDEEGTVFVVSHDSRAAALSAAVTARLRPLGMEVRSRRLPLGILVDSLPLARAGAAAVTVGRLTRRTLRIIHTPSDVPEGLSLDAAERIGRGIA